MSTRPRGGTKPHAYVSAQSEAAHVPRVGVQGWLGDRLVVRSDRAGTPALWLVDPSTGSFGESLTPGEIVGVARVVDDAVVFERDLDGDEVHQLFRVRPRGTAWPLVLEPGVIHDLGPVSSDRRWIAYASNADDTGRFDVRIRGVDGNADRVVWSPGGYTFPAAWSPDGRLMVVGRIGDRSLETELFLLEIATGRVARISPEDAGGALWGYADGKPVVTWRPNGESFLFLTNAGREYIGIAEWELNSSRWRYVLTRPNDLGFALDPTGSTLLVVENRAGRSRLVLHDASTYEAIREVELPAGGDVATDFSFSPDGRTIAFVLQGTARAPEVWTVSTSGEVLRQVTHDVASPSDGEFVVANEEWVISFDGERIQTLVYAPLHALERPAPAVIVLHGGPEMQAKFDFEPSVQALVAAGFLVLRPNIRGSTGFGRTFASLDDGRRRLDALRDVVELRRWAVTTGRASPDMVCLWGVSYGGLLANLALAHEPALWGGAVVAVAVSNLVTFFETIAPWRRPIREAEYGGLEDHREFFEQIAAVNNAGAIVAPLLLVHAANDIRVPIGESRQLREALRLVGCEPTLLVFEDDGHHFDRVANRARFVAEGVAFLEGVVHAHAGSR